MLRTTVAVAASSPASSEATSAPTLPPVRSTTNVAWLCWVVIDTDGCANEIEPNVHSNTADPVTTDATSFMWAEQPSAGCHPGCAATSSRRSNARFAGPPPCSQLGVTHCNEVGVAATGVDELPFTTNAPSLDTNMHWYLRMTTAWGDLLCTQATSHTATQPHSHTTTEQARWRQTYTP